MTMGYRECLMSAYKMEEFIIPMILLKIMNRVSCEKLNKFYEKYLVDNQKVDEIFFRELSNIKNKKHLTPLELIAILSWKIGYYAKIGRYIEAVSKKGFTEVKVCSETAFKLVDENRIDEALLKFADLLDIKWKTIAIPSAILVFYAYPSLPVIDQHSWFALYDERIESFYVNDYKKFLDDVTKIAKECNLTPRAVDCSLYQMGREKITLYQE